GFPEADGALKKDEQGEANLMRLAIGQGAIDDVTPLQVARMIAGIATGKLPQPILITRIGERAIVPPVPVDLGISTDHLEFVRHAMEEVVIRGTADADPAFKRNLVPFKVAGKTGTPQVGGEKPTHGCFAGYFPWDAPEWSFAVFIESCDMHGGEIAAPVINRILEAPEARPLFGEGIK
ncbi:MAG: penicillin-binding transpeptidase domain-containing protein, partial [Planctomycetota bacterium]